ncbi:MAG TPA: hypothetical protein VMU54_03665, partial [Planctomycetota bacterium]|nr:hypothetical protein [Planctomycetota bacterium]
MMHEIVARIHSRVHPAARLLGLLLLAGLIPACYSSSGKTYMAPPPPGGVGTIFSDGFASTFPAPNWAVTVNPAASASAATVYAPPNYYLDMTDTARPGSVSALTTMTFTPEPLTFVVNLAYSAMSNSTDTVSVQIVDNSGPPVVLAQAVLDANAQMITFTVGGGAATSTAFPAGTFENVTFTINSSNQGVWSVGGTSTTAAAFGSHTTALRLVANYATTANPAPTFQFHSVIVS